MSTRHDAVETLEPRVLFSAKPTLAPIASQTLLAGSPLHIPLDGFDRDSKALRYSVTSSDPRLTPTVFTGERSLKLDVRGFGSMKFYLYENRASRATSRIIRLAQSGFYDGITFHRVIDNFVIQTGDPTGTGSGGSNLNDFADQFHPDLQHNRAGILSMAKTSDDTNDSQFFVTDTATRSLDFNHTIFGQLVEGDAVRNAINSVATGANDKPTTNVVISRATVVSDRQNGVLMLKAPEGYTGSATVTVTATDEAGNKVTRTFTVNIQPDTVDGNAYLTPIGNIVGTPFDAVNTFQLGSVNVEGDAVFYDGVVANASPPAGFAFNVNNNTGLATFTAPAGFTGTVDVLVGVRDQSGANTVDNFDTQIVTLTIVPPDSAGATPETARNLGTLGRRLPQGTIIDALSSIDNIDFYKVKLRQATPVKLRLNNFNADTTLELFDSRGRLLSRSAKPGLAPELIRGTAAKGTYFIRVSTTATTNAGYALSMTGSAARTRAAVAPLAPNPALAAYWLSSRNDD